jgi:hypothetical protein
MAHRQASALRSGCGGRQAQRSSLAHNQQRGERSRCRTVTARAVLATPQKETQVAQEIGSLKKASLITAVKTP